MRRRTKKQRLKEIDEIILEFKSEKPELYYQLKYPNLYPGLYPPFFLIFFSKNN